MSVRCASWILPLLLAPLAAAQPAQAGDPPLALVGARVIVRPGQLPLEDATVLVRGGRIEAVGAGLELPFDARGVDCRGLTLTAGLLDAADERDLPFAPRATEQGRPYAAGRDVQAAMPLAERLGLAPERRAALVLPQDASARDAQRKAGFAAALVAPRGEALSGFASWLALSGRPPREALMDADVAQFGSLLWRSGPENYAGDSYPATLMGLMADLRQILLDAQWQGTLRTRHAGEAGWRGVDDPSLQALAPLLAGEVPLVLRAREEEDVRLALGLADQFPGLHLVLSGGTEAWHVADELARRHVGVIHDLDFGKEPEDPDAKSGSGKPGAAGKPGERGGEGAAGESEQGEAAAAKPEPAAEVAGPAPFDPGEPLALKRDRHRRWLEDVQGVAELRRKGVAVAFGSFGRDPDKLSEGLRTAMEKGGLSAEDALAGLTTAPAALLGGHAPQGEIAAGAPALLTAWTAEPLSKDARVRLLVVDGVLFDRSVDLAGEKPAKDEKKDEK